MTAVRLKERSELEESSTWRLEDIFENDQDWETEFKQTEELIGVGETYRGRLGESADTLLACLQWTDDLSLKIEEIYTYARMRRDEDNRRDRYQAMTDRAGMLSVKIGSALSFVAPEILSLPPAVFDEYDQDPALALYQRALREIVRQREHVLSLREEKILAETAELADTPHQVFTMANNADLKFSEIKDEQGQMVELTKGNYTQFMEKDNRQVRQDAFQTLYAAYGKQMNTWAALLNASVKKDVFYAKVRHYPSALEGSLDGDNIPLTVYDSLIETVHAFLPDLYRYLALRKKMLALEELHMYDIYVPIVPEIKQTIPFAQAKELIRQGLEPLGPEYAGILEQGFQNRWIDVYENVGKTSGAYSWGTYSAHPYVLLNHQDTLDSAFTLAHEMGHALHTWYSNRHQPYPYAGYKIFVAEVASTLNEALLSEHLMKTTADPKALAYIINHYLEQFRGTIFRQTMFAEFEKKTHERVESGESLTADALSGLYGELNAEYYGPGVVNDPEIRSEWARIPHFYSAFYVYKYATGFSAAIALANRILNKEKGAVEDYIRFLSSGSSAEPIELLRRAGVDMTTPQPVSEALKSFGSLVTRLEELLSEAL
ncbi:MAG: oligoendopeptidase F [Peptococcaceae bacterium]|jgi:oligoendopeptidase F|nr:oligoendopeptidase F [Peptococcaceae bacterium]